MLLILINMKINGRKELKILNKNYQDILENQKQISSKPKIRVCLQIPKASDSINNGNIEELEKQISQL